MELIPGRFLARIFFAKLDMLGPNAGDLLGWLYRDEGEDVWRFEYRFRYYEDDLVHGSKDRKSFYSGSSPPGQALSAFLPTVCFLFGMAGKGNFEVVIVDSADPAVIMARLKEQPWMHVAEKKRVK